jgi:coenzyme PQQ precursor peptide PqqA
MVAAWPATGSIHENHEARIMIRRLYLAGAGGDDASRDPENPRGRQPVTVQPRKGAFFMHWETPTAVDFRFGFEITMYVAAR